MRAAQQPANIIRLALCLGQPWTIAKIKKLKPKQSFVYYVGNLPRDIERSHFDGIIVYAVLLEAIRDLVAGLVKAGKAVVVHKALSEFQQEYRYTIEMR